MSDKQLFREIKAVIRKNPTEYQSAGKWLDDLLKNKQGFIIPMSKAFEEAYCEYPRDHRKIMLIVWLLTDKYLHLSKLGITKCEQYVFDHEIIEPESSGVKQTVTEQEFARDAVLYSNPEAMEIVRDALDAVCSPDKQDELVSPSIKRGNVWIFSFNGKTSQVPGTYIGLHYIAFLLDNRFKEFNPVTVEIKAMNTKNEEKLKETPDDIDEGLVLRNTGSRGGTLDGLTSMNPGQLKGLIENLEKKQEKTISKAEKDYIEENISVVKKLLKHDYKPNGKTKNFDGDAQKASHRIRRNIDKVKKLIKKEHQELYSHLNNIQIRETSIIYQPDTEISWEIS